MARQRNSRLRSHRSSEQWQQECEAKQLGEACRHGSLPICVLAARPGNGDPGRGAMLGE